MDIEETFYIHFSDKRAKLPFAMFFGNEWHSAVEEVAEEIGYTEEETEALREITPNPLVSVKDDGEEFLAVFGPLCITSIEETRTFIEEACDALDRALESIKEKFPDIEYNGCIQFLWMDSHTSDFVGYEIGEAKPHPYIGGFLKSCFANEIFWEELDPVNSKAMRKELMEYKDYFLEDTQDKIDEILDE